MPNQWGPRKQAAISPAVIGIIVLGIIGFMLFPKFLENTSTSTSALANQSTMSQDLSSGNLSNANTGQDNSQTNILNQGLSGGISGISGNGTNNLTGGYWVLFVNNGAMEQLSLNSQDFAFIQELVSSDANGRAAYPVFLVENGQIQRYTVSTEISSIIINLDNIYKRSGSNTIPNLSSSANSSSSIDTNPGTSNSGTQNDLNITTPNSSGSANTLTPSTPSESTQTTPNNSSNSTSTLPSNTTP